MTVRMAAVLARPDDPSITPPGVDPARYTEAMLEDVFELLDRLAQVEAAIAAPPSLVESSAKAGWPSTPVVAVPRTAAGVPVEIGVLADLGRLGADEAAVVAADAPDLPGLLVAKLFSGLSSAGVAVCPAEGGGLVAMACRLPVPGWFAEAGVGLDDADALDRLRAATPAAGALVVGPGWRRLRAPGDIARLDPGLEGWEATRALLSGHASEI